MRSLCRLAWCQREERGCEDAVAALVGDRLDLPVSGLIELFLVLRSMTGVLRESRIDEENRASG